MEKWNTPASDESIHTAIENLKKANIDSLIVNDLAQAKEKVLSLLPKNAEVMTMTSVTLEETGIRAAIDETDDYNSVKKILSGMDRATEGTKMQKLGAAPEWAVGSVHAITEDGKVLIASNTGSQLPAYAYGSSHVIWVVGTQKIVKNLDEAFERLYEHTFPLENERARKAYGTEGSNVSKMLIVQKEVKPGRITIIFIKQAVGF